MKGTISINHYSSLVVTIQSGVLDFSGHFSHGDGYIQVNTYHIDTWYSGTKRDFLKDLVKAMKGNFSGTTSQMQWLTTLTLHTTLISTLVNGINLMCSLVKRWAHFIQIESGMTKHEIQIALQDLYTILYRFKFTDTVTAINCAEDTLMGD